MKKMLSTVLAVVMLICLGLPAATADIIWTPMDEFFRLHEKECESVDLKYEASADTHSYDQPDGSIRSDIPAGKVLRVAYIWNGRWGSVEWSGEWVCLSDFRRLYDADQLHVEREPHEALLRHRQVHRRPARHGAAPARRPVARKDPRRLWRLVPGRFRQVAAEVG